VKIYDKDPKTGVKRLRDFRDIIDGIAASPLIEGPEKLTKAFGRDEAARLRAARAQPRAARRADREESDKSAIDRDAPTYQRAPRAGWRRRGTTIKLAIAEA
jgi:hypothetical protein